MSPSRPKLQLAQRVVAAAGEIDNQLASIQAASDRIGNLRNRSSELGAEFGSLVEARNERHLAATLAEEPLPSDDPEESARLRNIKVEIAAVEAAIPVLSRERHDLESALPALRKAHAEAFLHWKAVKVREALSSTSGALAKLQGPIAQLSALEATQHSVLGRSFDIGPAIDDDELRDSLLSTGTLAKRVLEALPKRVAPTDLSPEVLEPAAEAAKYEYLKELGQ